MEKMALSVRHRIRTFHYWSMILSFKTGFGERKREKVGQKERKREIEKELKEKE